MPDKGSGRTSTSGTSREQHGADRSEDPRTGTPEWVAIGRIGRAHGLHGEVRFFPYNDASDVFDELEEVQLSKGKQTVTARIVGLRGAARFMIMRLDIVTGRQDAEHWTHAVVSAPSDVFERLEEDEFYGFELEGLSIAHRDSGERVGHVEELTDFGAGAILRVRYRGVQLFVPFAEPYVGDVDLDAGVIEMDAEELLALHRSNR